MFKSRKKLVSKTRISLRLDRDLPRGKIEICLGVEVTNTNQHIKKILGHNLCSNQNFETIAFSLEIIYLRVVSD